jgi:hypothetical protein
MEKEVKPRIFEIRSENVYLLSAMGEELQKLGYIVSNYRSPTKGDKIYFEGDFTSLLNFKLLSQNKESLNNNNNTSVKVFNLPKDWDNALTFAKVQLDLPYWNEIKIFKINHYTIDIDYKTRSVSVDKNIIKFTDIIFLYESHLQYKKFIDTNTTDAWLELKIGCQQVKLSDLKDIYEHIINWLLTKE